MLDKDTTIEDSPHPIKKHNIIHYIKHHKLRCFMVFFAAGLIYVGISLFISRFALITTTYVYESDKINTPVNLVVLTDEHSSYFGKDNIRLIKKIKKQAPDCIAIVGDAINWYAEDEQFLTQMITDLSKLAPVYYTPGNHENAYLATQKKFSHELREVVETAGGIYMDQNFSDISIKGQKLRMGGLYDYVFNQARVPDEQYEKKGSYGFLKVFDNTERFKVLLTHRPESCITDDEDAQWSIDLALCGHEHGGQIRIPGIGGFYSTHLGLFSEYIDGYYILNGIPVVTSKGLGTYYSKRTPPRFNNPPEIVVISLH